MAQSVAHGSGLYYRYYNSVTQGIWTVTIQQYRWHIQRLHWRLHILRYGANLNRRSPPS
jgi:hypothetical protein